MNEKYKIGFETTGLTNVNKALSNVTSNADNASNSLVDVNERLRAQDEIVGNIVQGFNIFGFSINSVTRSLIALDGSVDGLGQGLLAFQTAFNQAQIAGLGMTSSITEGFTAMKKSGMTLRGVLTKTFLPLTVAVGIIYTLKTAWDNNIGGMQVKFASFVGDMKQGWAEFETSFIKILKSIEPIFTVLFDSIAGNVKFLMNIFNGLAKGILAIVKPIGDVLKELASVFDVFNDSSENSISIMDILATSGKILGTTLEWIGKTIGFVLKMNLLPLKTTLGFIADGVEFVVKGWQNLIEAFKETAVFEYIKNIFEQIVNLINNVISGLNKIPGVNIGGNSEDEKNTVKSGTRGGSSSVKNNNQVVNVNTSREIDRKNGQQFGDVLARQLDN